MKKLGKYTAAAVLTGALAIAAATPSQARHGRIAAAGIGFAAGALVGAAAANAASGPYYYGPAYYGPAPYYAEPYAYEPAPVYAEPAPARGCWHATDKTRGFGYYGACTK
ncbi:MAG TPA: hypothetical protein VFX37_05110 [Pseudolabrys sp.]|nr:hypothetical protein [Pseudolabrys sp.]